MKRRKEGGGRFLLGVEDERGMRVGWELRGIEGVGGDE